MTINERLAEELEIGLGQVNKAVELLDEGNTIPFIARYRKEVTGGLSDEALRNLGKRLESLRSLEDRKETVLKSIEDQGKLDDELKEKITKAQTLSQVEDLYLPFKKKRSTRASVAEDKGFRPLAEYIMASEGTEEELEEKIASFIGEEAENREAALAYASDIIAGDISENAEVRTFIRENALKNGGISTEKAKDGEDSGTYSNYYSYAERIGNILPHRILAILRGEEEEELKVSFDLDDVDNILYIRKIYNPDPKKGFGKILDNAILDSYTRLIAPSISNQVRSSLKDFADEKSIEVFAKNLRPYLMQAPIKDKRVLAMDPGFRTGVKLAVISEYGDFLDSGQIFIEQSKKKEKEAEETLKKLIDKYQPEIIAIGNGTASRETEKFVTDFIKKHGYKDLAYLIVNESGASIYSASELGQEEFPDLDVSIRGAVSIGRRIQDPLAELVKIEPKHIGVGQYQHDVNQKKLDEALEAVVESCVNSVGVDINNASSSLLEYVAGLSKTNAKNILDYKEENGIFTSKAQLKDVKGIGPKTFEQCAGFIRVPESDNPLDNTGVHPESYGPAKSLIGKDLDKINIKEEAEKLGIGEPTLADIIKELKKPGRDPREELGEVILRSDILSMDDLKIGTVLKGTVRNVVDFGAFVDIGVETDGLVHISEMSESFIDHPSSLVKPGDIVEVKIIDIDKKKNRISLSMKI